VTNETFDRTFAPTGRCSAPGRGSAAAHLSVGHPFGEACLSAPSRPFLGLPWYGLVSFFTRKERACRLCDGSAGEEPTRATLKHFGLPFTGQLFDKTYA